jgi:hypothetical protein
MKGTIDVQIKHKDGSIETRHEHNVVFDLQALQTKHFYSRPYGPLTGFCGFNSISKSTYDIFSLSTLELDLTKPSVAIPALNSISSGSSSVWYTAPITSTIEDKYKISSATWTVSEALTLKSIFFPYSALFFAADPSNNGDDSQYRRCILTDDGLFVDQDCSYRLLPISTAFKFTNNYLHGFANEEYFSQTTGERAFVPYKLHDPTERFLFDTISGTSHYRSYYPYYSAGELQIKDAPTNTVKRSFNLSQFADFSADARRAVRVVNTGSKNFLLEPVSTAAGIRVWEIPDIATEETIQPSGMILADKDIYVYNSSYFPQGSYSVADNVLIYRHQSNSGAITCAKINDDLSVDIVPGANAAGISVSSSALTNNSYNTVVFPYINADSPWLYRVGAGSYPKTFAKSGTYYCRFFNSTAANFSTPIVLAEGDVLTVSYKIEVA